MWNPFLVYGVPGYIGRGGAVFLSVCSRGLPLSSLVQARSWARRERRPPISLEYRVCARGRSVVTCPPVWAWTRPIGLSLSHLFYLDFFLPPSTIWFLIVWLPPPHTQKKDAQQKFGTRNKKQTGKFEKTLRATHTVIWLKFFGKKRQPHR